MPAGLPVGSANASRQCSARFLLAHLPARRRSPSWFAQLEGGAPRPKGLGGSLDRASRLSVWTRMRPVRARNAALFFRRQEFREFSGLRPAAVAWPLNAVRACVCV